MFRKGDKVVCVDVDAAGKWLVAGETYVVQSDEKFGYIDINRCPRGPWLAARFRLVDPAPAPTLTAEQYEKLRTAARWYIFAAGDIVAWIDHHYQQQPKTGWYQDDEGRWRLPA